MREQVEFFQKGRIQSNSIPFGASSLLDINPNGAFRICIGFWTLNKAINKNQYLIPEVDGLLDHLRVAKVSRAMDRVQGYYQIRIQNGEYEKIEFRFHMEALNFK